MLLCLAFSTIEMKTSSQTKKENNNNKEAKTGEKFYHGEQKPTIVQKNTRG